MCYLLVQWWQGKGIHDFCYRNVHIFISYSAVLAFEHRKRAMSATDVLDQIGKSFNELLEHP